MKKKTKIAVGTIIVMSLGFVLVTALIRHVNMYRFPRVPHDYVPRQQDTVVCSRPMDTLTTQFLYPLFKHNYIKTVNGTYGYQFCDAYSDVCPGNVGPNVLPDNPRHIIAKNPSLHQCWLVSTDAGYQKCVMSEMEKLQQSMWYPNRFGSVLGTACTVFTDEALDRCKFK